MNVYFADFFGAYFRSRCCYVSTLKMCAGGSLDFGFLRQPSVAFGGLRLIPTLTEMI